MNLSFNCAALRTGLMVTAGAAWAIGCGTSTPAGNDGGSGGTEATGSGGSGAGAPGAGGAASGGAAVTGGSPGAGGSSAGGSGAGGGAIVGTISDLTIVPNPNSVLSAYVTWTTTEPSDSVVQFGEGTLTWQIAKADSTTEHEVLVVGMHASSTYQIHARSSGVSGTVAGDGTFTTDALPAQIPEGIISVSDGSRVAPGWTLMNVQKGNGEPSAFSSAPAAAVIYDELGKPVWYFINGTAVERGGAISVDPTDVGVLMGPVQNLPNMVTAPTEVDWAGNTTWTCADILCGGTDLMSHHAGKLSNGNFIVMRDAQVGGRTSQVFEEFDPFNQLVHTIGVEDAVTPPAGATGDWAHGNAITVDLDDDAAYLSFRWLGLIKMTYSDRTIQWHLPASYGGEDVTDSPKMTFNPPTSQFSDIHDPEIHDDGTILFFDNGGFTGQIAEGNPTNLHTRALEYAIDESEPPTATLVWEWPGTFDVDPWYKTELYAPFWGDADRLSNGNVLITVGRRGTGSTTPESRIIEVTKEAGEVVWEMKLPKDHGVYRAERITPPLVTPIP